MSRNAREVLESPVDQGAEERIAYKVTIPASWGTNPFTDHQGKLYSFDPVTNTYTDVSGTLMTGAQTSSGAVITTPLVISLIEGTTYRYEGRFDTTEGNQEEFYFWIKATR